MTHVAEPLLVIEEIYVTPDRCVALAPFLPQQPSRIVRVRYEAPDGSGGVVDGRIEATTGRVWAPGRVAPAHESAIVIESPGFDALIGTRIWLVDET